MWKSKPYDEKKAIESLAEGNADAFTQLFNCYNGAIYRVALRFLKSPEMAEEVVQEVFLKVWLRRKDMVAAVNFEAYLFTMARNLVFDRIKQLAKEVAAKSEFTRAVKPTEAADQPLVEKQYEELLQDAVDRLPPQQKQVFRLARVEGLSHQAIAEQLHLSRLTVKSHMAKALQAIRQNLQRHITMISLLAMATLS